MNISPRATAAVIFLVLPLFLPEPAAAIQTHAAPEGLYVHLIGHILFAVAMGGFAYRIRRSRLGMEGAWRLMSLGAILFALWNVWAGSGHILEQTILKTDFMPNDARLLAILNVHSPADFLYYLFKMDHLLCVPALLFIYFALKKMTTEKMRAEQSE